MVNRIYPERPDDDDSDDAEGDHPAEMAGGLKRILDAGALPHSMTIEKTYYANGTKKSKVVIRYDPAAKLKEVIAGPEETDN